VLFDRRGLKSAPAETLRGSRNGLLGKIRQGNCNRGIQKAKWVLYYSAQADSGRARDVQALLRHAPASSGMLRLAQACSGLLRLAHPQLRLKQQLLTSAD
jgi:hypothetical protein